VVEELPGEFDATDAVGHGVVEAERDRRPAADDTVNDRQLPEGAGDVERRGHRGLDDTKHGTDVGGIGNSNPPKVEVERVVVARDPVGAAERPRPGDQPLPQPRELLLPRGECGAHALIPGFRVEQSDDEDRRAQHWIRLDPPHQLVGAGEALRERIVGLQVQPLQP
jgi:hypothetical protein